MKLSKLILIGTAAALTISTSMAQRGPGGKGRGPARGAGAGAGGAIVPGPRGGVEDLAELGAIRDQFEAFQRMTAGGAKYYTKEEAKLRERHVKTYGFIRMSVVEDRLQEAQARKLIQVLFTIGEEHLQGDTKTDARLSALKEKIQELRADKVDQDVLSPRLNESQFKLDELHRFAVAEEALSTGEASSLRRKLDRLEEKEDSAKAKELSDRNREKLIEESREIWRSVVKDLQD